MAKKIDINGLDHFKDKENAMIASEYSSSQTYAVGDYCYHAGTLYRCTTAITTAEAWTAGHWTAAKLADDTSELKTAITQLEDSEASFSNDTGYAAYISDGVADSDVKSAICTLPYNSSGYGALRLYHVKGKNLLAGINASQTINGVTFTVNADGTVSTSGTASANTNFFLHSSFPVKAGVAYALTGCPSGGGNSTYSLSLGGAYAKDTGNGGLYIPVTDMRHDVRIYVVSGTNMNGLTFNPMIRYAYQTSENYNENMLSPSVKNTSINGLVFIANPDGTIVVNGVSNAYTTYYIQTGVPFVAGKTYRLSGCPVDGSVSTYRMNIGGVFAVDTGNGGVFTETSTTTHDVRIVIESGVTFNGVIFKPHLTEVKGLESDYVGTDADTYITGFPTMVYGGYLNFITGELVATTAQNGSAINPPVSYSVTPNAIKLSDGDNTFFANAGYVNVEYTKDLGVVRERAAKVDFLENYKKYQKTLVTSSLTVGLPILYLVGDTSAMNKDVEANLDWYFEDKSGKCTLKWQGSSSIAYSKKNYTIKFGSNVDFGKGWGSQKKYNLKANYIDFSEARNVVSARLWGAIVKSRTVQNPYLYNLPDGGAIDGFPVIVALNNEYHGLYNMNIPKDKWMFNMTGTADYEGFLSAEDHSLPTQFKATITKEDLLAETSFASEYCSTDDVGWMATSVSQAISSVMSATSSADATTIDQYIDLASVIDHYIFACLIGGTDITDKNYLLATFDGTKWYMSEWDLDTTFGNHWTGGSYNGANSFPTFADYATQSDLMKFVYTYMKPELKARYATLRATTLSVANVCTMFNNFCVTIPKEIKNIDAKKYPLLPATDTSSPSQVVDWYMERCKILDAEIAALT